MNSSVWGGIAGLASSIAYFQLSESTVPKESNCSYLAPVSTDVLAMVAGTVLWYRGYHHNDALVTFVGSCVLGIHAQQMLAHKGSEQ